jgi:hypothetical protein
MKTRRGGAKSGAWGERKIPLQSTHTQNETGVLLCVFSAQHVKRHHRATCLPCVWECHRPVRALHEGSLNVDVNIRAKITSYEMDIGGIFVSVLRKKITQA